MKVFSGINDKLGIDMGSSQIRIYSDKKVILEEASCAALEDNSGKILGFGTDAIIRSHSSGEDCRIEWTIRNGIMVDYEITKKMLRYFINKAIRHSVSRPTVMMATPCEISSVVRHALVDALAHAGAQQIFLLSAPVAAAIGAGVIIDTPEAVLSTVIGKDVTDCGIYCAGGVVEEHGISFGGKTIDEGIRRFVQAKYHLMIGMTQAEQLKREWISVVHTGESSTFTIRGRRIADGVEIILELTERNLSPIMQRILQPVVQLIKKVMRAATPEMAEDLLKNGMILSGGTAKLSGIDEWIASQIGVPVFVADEPENVVAKGCCLALGNAVRLPMLVESGEKYYGGI